MEKILLVEDDEILGKVMSEELKEAGFEVIRMKYNEGLFGKYKGQKEEYQHRISELESQGIQVVYRESKAKENI